MRKGLTQKEAAKHLHRSVNTIKGWESGRSDPSTLDDVVRLCQLYGVSVDYYITGSRSDSLPDKHIETATKLAKLSPSAQQAILSLIDELLPAD